MSAIRRLADGLYEEVVTGELARALELIAHERHIDAPELGDDAHVILARLLRADRTHVCGYRGGPATTGSSDSSDSRRSSSRCSRRSDAGTLRTPNTLDRAWAKCLEAAKVKH